MFFSLYFLLVFFFFCVLIGPPCQLFPLTCLYTWAPIAQEIIQYNITPLPLYSFFSKASCLVFFFLIWKWTLWGHLAHIRVNIKDSIVGDILLMCHLSLAVCWVLKLMIVCFFSPPSSISLQRNTKKKVTKHLECNYLSQILGSAFLLPVFDPSLWYLPLKVIWNTWSVSQNMAKLGPRSADVSW